MTIRFLSVTPLSTPLSCKPILGRTTPLPALFLPVFFISCSCLLYGYEEYGTFLFLFIYFYLFHLNLFFHLLFFSVTLLAFSIPNLDRLSLPATDRDSLPNGLIIQLSLVHRTVIRHLAAFSPLDPSQNFAPLLNTIPATYTSFPFTPPRRLKRRFHSTLTACSHSHWRAWVWVITHSLCPLALCTCFKYSAIASTCCSQQLQPSIHIHLHLPSLAF